MRWIATYAFLAFLTGMVCNTIISKEVGRQQVKPEVAELKRELALAKADFVTALEIAETFKPAELPKPSRWSVVE